MMKDIMELINIFFNVYLSKIVISKKSDLYNFINRDKKRWKNTMKCKQMREHLTFKNDEDNQVNIKNCLTWINVRFFIDSQLIFSPSFFINYPASDWFEWKLLCFDLNDCKVTNICNHFVYVCDDCQKTW